MSEFGLAEAAVQAALDAGARYADARVMLRRAESMSARDGEIGRDAQYDLLTAALIGAAIGATATLLLRRGPSGTRPVAPVIRGAKWAGRGAMAAGASAADHAVSPHFPHHPIGAPHDPGHP